MGEKTLRNVLFTLCKREHIEQVIRRILWFTWIGVDDLDVAIFIGVRAYLVSTEC